MAARNKKEVQPIRPETPIYPIGVAAKLLNVHPRTLRIYEAEGLIKPTLTGKRRLFSDNDLAWIRCIRGMIHDQGISIPGIKRLLELAPCWEIRECNDEVRENCQAAMDRSLGEELRRARESRRGRSGKNGDSSAVGEHRNG